MQDHHQAGEQELEDVPCLGQEADRDDHRGNDWDIDLIVLTGGGSRELARHLKPLIDGNVVPLEPHLDSRLNNVFGYVKYAKFIWGAAATSKSPPDKVIACKPEIVERAAAAAM